MGKLQKSFLEVGKCIYCGQVPVNGEEPLSKEHIIPHALGGNVTLLAASCAKHRDITSKTEAKVLRCMFGEFRLHTGIKKPARTHHLPIVLIREDGDRLVEYPLNRHPHLLPMILFEPAGFRGGHDGTSLKLSRIGMLNYQPDYQNRANLVGSYRQDTLIDCWAFGRLLAKIAHGLAVREFGVNGFEHFLVPVIDGTEERLFFYVGGSSEPLHGTGLHSCRLEVIPFGSQWMVIAKIKLFAKIADGNAPTYEVLVGSMSHGPKFIRPTT